MHGKNAKLTRTRCNEIKLSNKCCLQRKIQVLVPHLNKLTRDMPHFLIAKVSDREDGANLQKNSFAKTISPEILFPLKFVPMFLSK